MRLSLALLEKGVDDLLFLPDKLLAFFQPVGLAFNIDNGTVMQNTVEDGGSDGDIGKNLVPLGEGFVGGKDGGGLLVTSGDELKEEICALDIHGEIANFVNNKHPVLCKDFELVR